MNQLPICLFRLGPTVAPRVPFLIIRYDMCTGRTKEQCCSEYLRIVATRLTPERSLLGKRHACSRLLSELLTIH